MRSIKKHNDDDRDESRPETNKCDIRDRYIRTNTRMTVLLTIMRQAQFPISNPSEVVKKVKSNRKIVG